MNKPREGLRHSESTYTQNEEGSQKVLEPDPLIWTPEETQTTEELKQALISALVLALPSLEKPFHLFVTVDHGIALGVLTQTWEAGGGGGQKQLVVFISKLLDPVSRGWPECMQAVAATALLVKESKKLTFGGTLIVKLFYIESEIYGIKEPGERDDLVLTTDACLNPTSFLWKGEEIQEASEHNCLDIIEYKTKVRPNLSEVPLHDGTKLFVDGSSRVIEGKRHNGYGNKHALCEGGRLPNSWTAQTCELYALNQALKLLKGQKGTIYTDSKYAYRVNGGLINSKENELVQEELVRQVLESLLFLTEVAVVHVNGYLKGGSMEAGGNRLAGEAAKQASLEEEIRLLSLIPSIPKVTLNPQFTIEEEEELDKIGAI
ncbi:hypothetical protein QTO34_000416 [Cnephaeus nilssonii]|uniref:RNase H type-1 domain-containing protein n=1 Tax=Cnephaeus nilssonii TaxID=3371016 RepID=A0AA40LWW0_CNENI|nr:hypothetical protein QTO34_000416 [Eptesicus nilssonii]